jgi:hypothetical protein
LLRPLAVRLGIAFHIGYRYLYLIKDAMILRVGEDQENSL